MINDYFDNVVSLAAFRFEKERNNDMILQTEDNKIVEIRRNDKKESTKLRQEHNDKIMKGLRQHGYTK